VDNTVTADLIAWLRAQLDEDERMATTAAKLAGLRWRVEPYEPSEPGAFPTGVWIQEDGPGDMVHGVAVASGSFVADHIALHDPARVLADITAKRAILARHDGFACAGCEARQLDEDEPLSRCTLVRLLASVYAARPGYRQEWAP
jgi:hypothetical protein